MIGRLFLIKDRGLVGCFWEWTGDWWLFGSEKTGDWPAVSGKGPGIGGLFLRKEWGLVGCFRERTGDWWAISEKTGD